MIGNERQRRELRERLQEARSAPVARAATTGLMVGAAGGLLRRSREGALAGIAVAALVRNARTEAAATERLLRDSEDLATLAPRLGHHLTELGNWAVDADFARLALTEAERRGGLIVELGSGVSTLLIASMLSERGGGRLISVDHDHRFGERTRALLAEAGHPADVVIAPLRSQELAGTTAEWYDPEALQSALPDEPISLLIVDGPPVTSTWSRWPAIEVLGPHLVEDAVVLLDDGRRRAERATALRWARNHPELSLSWHDTLKGAWRLDRHSPQPESRRRRAGRLALRRINPNPSGFGRWAVRR